MAASELKRAAVIRSMANRISAKSGFPIEIIIAIISQLLPLILGGCKPPATANDAKDLITLAVKKHPDVCPIWYRPAFRQNGVKDKDDINDLWSGFVFDSNEHMNDVALAMVA